MIHVSHLHKTLGVPLHPGDKPDLDRQLARMFPEAPRVTFQGSPVVILPHGVRETKLLRTLGLDVPAPILGQYGWCGGTPFEVQRQTAAMLTTHTHAYVLNSMGTGKTKAALWAYDFLRREGLAHKALVVAPLSTLNFTWAREVLHTVPHLKVAVLHHSDRAKRLARLAEDADIYIINPAGLGIIEEALKAREDIDLFVIDELATFRNGTSARSKLCRRIARRMSWVWGMTGSPTPNEPSDAWAQAQIVTPHTVPKFFNRFRDDVMMKMGAFKWVPKKEAGEKVLQALRPAVRFTLDEVVELPELVSRVRDIDLGPRQAKVYEQLRAHAYALVQSKEITAANAGAVLSKLLQVSLGYVYTTDKGIVALDNDERLEALVDDVNACDRKLLVWVPFTHAINGVHERLAKEGIESAIVNGETPRAERERIFGLFQNTNRLKVIAAHPATASHGLTLTAADTIIWFGPVTSLEIYEQANARIRRVGQKHKQLVLHYQATAAERRMYSHLRNKQRIQDNILDLFEQHTLDLT